MVPGLLSVPVRSVVIDSNLTRAAAELVSKLDLGEHLAVVMDPATARVMGNAVAKCWRRASGSAPS